ncbi:AAA family ATPase [Ruminococcus difficilis]|uniref:AAA family ATPase n=1 Tax=Ruminococcus difficilis TaxID=2763069 RepID=A0A934WRQ1_9FIRM|nr:AAA family ATPase [Ruminococcus difficilis]MBK6088703.1 AAA family ATPase [Ruminococcus difficilis]
MEENWNLDIDSYPKTLNTLDGVTLAEMDLPPIKYVIKDLLPQGLAMLNGSMKIGKSWMVLDWCVRIAKGENIWNFPTTKGTTLYLSLEDSNTRLQAVQRHSVARRKIFEGEYGR